MDNVAALKKRIRAGSPIRLVFYTDRGSVAIKASIATTSPLSVVVKSADAKLIAEGDRTLLVLFDRNEYFKAEAAVTGTSCRDGEYMIELSDELWEEVDRRRYPRQAFSAPVELRAIREVEGESTVDRFVGETQDISVGGVWVTLDHPIEPGSLVEVQVALSAEENIRMMGVVAHLSNERAGFGIEFIDYVGSARYTLHTFLAKEQAA